MEPTQDVQKPDDTQLKLYGMLVDQIQKFNTILWQFPVTLLAGNAYALANLSTHPWFLLGLAAVDAVFTFTVFRLVTHQRVIIDATRAAEAELSKTSYSMFLPKFTPPTVRASSAIVWLLVLVTVSLFVFSGVKIRTQDPSLASLAATNSPSAILKNQNEPVIPIIPPSNTVQKEPLIPPSPPSPPSNTLTTN